MARVQIYSYTVEGIGAFPLDMLRRDRCWPADSNDAARLDGEERRAVALRGLDHPTGDRWLSFGWEVLECSKVITNTG